MHMIIGNCMLLINVITIPSPIKYKMVPQVYFLSLNLLGALSLYYLGSDQIFYLSTYCTGSSELILRCDQSMLNKHKAELICEFDITCIFEVSINIHYVPCFSHQFQDGPPQVQFSFAQCTGSIESRLVTHVCECHIYC